jgi:hypothetical protein
MTDVILTIVICLAVFVGGFFLGRRSERVLGKYDGNLNVLETEPNLIQQLEILSSPEKTAEKGMIRLRVRRVKSAPVVNQ